MVKNGQSPIRAVQFDPPAGAAANTEVTTLSWIRERGGPSEFIVPQRLGFDLLMRIEAGGTVHAVDFTGYSLAPDDVLWVRAGQVQQWGRIADIEGTVVLFTPHSVDRPILTEHNHWPGVAAGGSPVGAAFDYLVTADRDSRALAPAVRAGVVTHILASVILRLVASTPVGGTATGTRDEVYRWFREEVEQRFHTQHRVGDYAARLGYSARTINRAAQANTGWTAKQLIDQRVVLEAKRLLAHQDDPVADIAGRLGFADTANFSKYFRHLTGVTPSAFRSQVRSGLIQ